MTISTLRISFIMTETILDLHRGKAGPMPLASYVSEPGYIDIVDAVQRGDAAPLRLCMPWPYTGGQHFWNAYLYDQEPADAGGKLCFEKLVPLRLPQLAEKIEANIPDLVPPENVRMEIKGYYYPYGTGLVVTATLSGAFDIKRAGSLAFELRFGKVHRMTWPGEAVTEPLMLEQLLVSALNRLRTVGFGDGIAGVRSQIFSLATVLRGSEVDPNQPLVPDSPTHRLLNGLAGWVKDWAGLRPPALVDGTTQLRRQRATAWPSNVLCAAKRGRAVWFPGHFLPASPGRRLSCYHHNLCFGSLQAESLLMLTAEVSDVFAGAPAVPASIQRLGRISAGLLARLSGGKKSYRSDSLRAQIAQSDQLADVNALRQRFGMPAIA
jgi:hypothetical protein